jgi:hypothetical protein
MKLGNWCIAFGIGVAGLAIACWLRASARDTRICVSHAMLLVTTFVCWSVTADAHALPKLVPPPGPGLSLQGVTMAGTTKHILVGQLILANVISPVLPASPPPAPLGWSFEWTISGGDPFKQYTVSSAGAEYYGYTPPTDSWFTSWYFAKPGTYIVQCKVTHPNGEFTVTDSVVVDGPVYVNGGSDMGDSKLFFTPPLNPPAPPFAEGPPDFGFALWGAQLMFAGVTQHWGILWKATVTTPSTPAYGSGGVWNYTQLISPSTLVLDPEFGSHWLFQFTDTNGDPIWPAPVLDGSYPYHPVPPDPEFSANTSEQLFSDAPFTQFADWWIGTSNGDSYEAYILYTPPPGPLGAVKPVPITKMAWAWSSNALRLSYLDWTLSGTKTPPAFTSYPSPFPKWKYCAGPIWSVTPPYP